MTSFKDKILEKVSSEAYLIGVDCYNDENKECPFLHGSPAWEEWYNGWLDALFLDNMINGD